MQYYVPLVSIFVSILRLKNANDRRSVATRSKNY